MSGIRIQVYADYQAMSREAARQIADIIREKPDATLVAAVGNSPVGTYQELARLRAQGELDTSHLRVFQLDEYLNLPGDDERLLYSWVRRDVLEPLGISEDRFVRLQGSTQDHRQACQDYDRAVIAVGGFDIVVLGLGPNGHLGFNEPLSDATSPTRTVALTEASLKSNATYWGGLERVPREAVTCGMPHLLQGRAIFLLVSGAHKQDILRRTVQGPVTPEVPSSYLQGSEHVYVLADQAAWSITDQPETR